MKPIIKNFEHRARLAATQSAIRDIFGEDALLVELSGVDPVDARVAYGESRVDMFCTGTSKDGFTIDFDIYGPDNSKFSEINGIRYEADCFDGQQVLDRINLEITNAEAIYENPE